MSVRQFLLDENVDPNLKRALRQRMPEMVVWIVSDPGAPGLSTADPDILIWCETHNFALVTNNRSSMPVHLRERLAAGKHIPGIFILSRWLTMSETVEELALIWGASSPEEYVDLVNHLPLS